MALKMDRRFEASLVGIGYLFTLFLKGLQVQFTNGSSFAEAGLLVDAVQVDAVFVVVAFARRAFLARLPAAALAMAAPALGGSPGGHDLGEVLR